MKLHAVAFVALTAACLPVVAQAGSITFQDTVPKGSSAQVTVNPRKAAAFTVVLRTPAVGRTRLYLLGKTAPKGGALIDTKSYACAKASGRLKCAGSYEALPAGAYTFRVAYAGPAAQAASVSLIVRW